MEDIKEMEKAKGEEKNVAYKIAMLGDSGVGKTALTYQFTTSEYICAYDLSLDDDYGQKTVSVLLNNQETDLEVIDHPACEMSVSGLFLISPLRASRVCRRRWLEVNLSDTLEMLTQQTNAGKIPRSTC